MIEYIKKIIATDTEKKGRIFTQIMEKDRLYWRKFGTPDKIFEWLANFSGKKEIYLALVLANNTIYHPLEEVRSLWRRILMNRAKSTLLNQIFGDGQPPNIAQWFEEYLRERCVFVGFGKAAKSGQAVVYGFKQSHGLENLTYMELFELLHNSKKLAQKDAVFLLDDFVGSGNQATGSWFDKIGGRCFDDLHKENPHLKFFYLVLAGLKDGKKTVEDNTPMRVILGEELDETFKCFSDSSVIYTDPRERKEARDVMQKKGKMLHKYPLGYDDGQLALAFYHNTPDNTLPVIWKRMDDGTWCPLFERFE